MAAKAGLCLEAGQVSGFGNRKCTGVTDVEASSLFFAQVNHSIFPQLFPWGGKDEFRELTAEQS